MRRPALALAAVLLAGQAPADKPPGPPIRDLTVDYIVQDTLGPREPTRGRPLKVYWAKGGARMRIQMEDERSYVVLDRDARRMLLVLLDQQGYVEMPYDPKRLTGFTVPPDLPVARGRTEVVAGYTCTLWHARRLDGSSSLCVTDDGVLLRAEGYGEQQRGDLVATSLAYGPQPATAFAAPAGFHKLDLGAAAATPKP